MVLMEYQNCQEYINDEYSSFKDALMESFRWRITPENDNNWEEEGYWDNIHNGKTPDIMPWKKDEEIIGSHIKMYPEFNGKRVKMNDRFETEHIWSPELAFKNNNRWTPELVEEPKEQSLAELESEMGAKEVEAKKLLENNGYLVKKKHTLTLAEIAEKFGLKEEEIEIEK